MAPWIARSVPLWLFWERSKKRVYVSGTRINGLINNLIDKVDTLIVGGGMAYTFLKAKGYEVGDSLLDEERIELAKEMMDRAQAKGVEFLLPVDITVASEFAADAEHKVVAADEIPAGWQGLDIGPKTLGVV